MYCHNCGEEMVAEHAFCPACGNEVNKGSNTISSGSHSANTIGSEIKDSIIHVGDNYADSNNIDPSILNIKRNFVCLPWSKNGKLANRSSIFKLGTWGSLASIIGLFLPYVTSFNYSSFWFVFGFCLSMLFVILSMILKEHRFTHFIGLKNLEAGTDDGIYLTQITCDCPWCGSQMKLRKVGSENEREHLLLCKRSPALHRIKFDPTVMPDIEE